MLDIQETVRKAFEKRLKEHCDKKRGLSAICPYPSQCVCKWIEWNNLKRWQKFLVSKPDRPSFEVVSDRYIREKVDSILKEK